MILLSKFNVPIGWTIIVQRTCHQIYRGQCFGWAAALAYYSFLALFPALLFVVSVASFLPIQHLIAQLVDMVGRFAPDEVVAIAREQLLQITDKPHGRLLALSLMGTVWSMSSGMVALIGTLNQANHASDGRPWWRIRATAIALTGALTLFMLLSFMLAMVGPTAVERVADWSGALRHDVQSMMTLPESPARAASNAASCSRNPNRWVMAGVISSPDWSITVILYQVSYISRP
jgi:membrane protein